MIKYFTTILFSVALIMSCSVPTTSNMGKGESQQPPISGGQETNKPAPEQNPNPKPDYVGPVALTVQADKIERNEYPNSSLVSFLTQNHDWAIDSTLNVKLNLSSNDLYTANVTGCTFKIVDPRKNLSFVELIQLDSAEVIERGISSNKFKVRIKGKVKSQYKVKDSTEIKPTSYDNTTVLFTMSIDVPNNRYWEDKIYSLKFEDLQDMNQDAVAALITKNKYFNIRSTKIVNN